MPKLPLIGGENVSRSPAASAQTCINLYPQKIEAPEGKNDGVLFLCPGRHVFQAALTGGGSIMGFWTGGGRLFVAHGDGHICELDESAVESHHFQYVTPLIPANQAIQMFGNGNQLLIIANEQAFIDNGSGPVVCRFRIEGTVDVTVDGSAALKLVAWVSGDKWDPAVVAGMYVTINGQNHLVASSANATHMVLSTAVTGVSGTVTRVGSILFYSSGTTFVTGSAWVGLPITLNGTVYTIESVQSQYVMSIAERPLGTEYAVVFSFPVLGAAFSAAAGDIVTAITGAFLKDKFYVQRPSGGTPDLGRQVSFSDVNDGTVWRGLDFFTKESHPDYIQGILSDGSLLYVFGTESGEVYQIDKGTGLPALIDGGCFQVGMVSPWACSSAGGQVFFMGISPRGGPVAYRLNGFTPFRVSTHAEEEQFSDIFDMNTRVAFCSVEEINGHVFWITNALYPTTGSGAIAYDLVSGLWHRRRDWNPSLVPPAFEDYAAQFHAFVPEWGTEGRHFVAGGGGSTVYEESVEFFDNHGLDMTWQKALPYRYNGGNQIYHGRMTLEMETGTVASGPAPNITRDYSDDRGRTYVNPQSSLLGIGAHAEFSRRVFWPTGGSSRGRVWRLTGTGQYKLCLVDLECEETMGIV